MAVLELEDNPGPAVMGHDPIVVGDARKKALNVVENTGAVSFRDDPAFPWLNTN